MISEMDLLHTYEGRHGKYEVDFDEHCVEIWLNCIDDGEPAIWIEFYDESDGKGFYFPCEIKMIMIHKGIADYLNLIMQQYFELEDGNLIDVLKIVQDLLDQVGRPSWGFPRRRKGVL